MYFSFLVVVSSRSVGMSSECFSIDAVATGDATCPQARDLANKCATCKQTSKRGFFFFWARKSVSLPPRYIRRKIKKKNEEAVRFLIWSLMKFELRASLCAGYRSEKKTGIKGSSRHFGELPVVWSPITVEVPRPAYEIKHIGLHLALEK